MGFAGAFMALLEAVPTVADAEQQREVVTDMFAHTLDEPNRFAVDGCVAFCGLNLRGLVPLLDHPVYSVQHTAHRVVESARAVVERDAQAGLQVASAAEELPYRNATNLAGEVLESHVDASQGIMSEPSFAQPEGRPDELRSECPRVARILAIRRFLISSLQPPRRVCSDSVSTLIAAGFALASP